MIRYKKKSACLSEHVGSSAGEISWSPRVLVRVPKRNRTNRIWKEIVRNWLMQLWKLRSPTIYSLQAWHPSPKAWEQESSEVNPHLRAEKEEGRWDVPFRQWGRTKGQIPPSSVFCSIQSSKGWHMPTHMSYWIKYSSHLEQSHIPRNNTESGHPIAHLHWHIKSTFMPPKRIFAESSRQLLLPLSSQSILFIVLWKAWARRIVVS